MSGIDVQENFDHQRKARMGRLPSSGSLTEAAAPYVTLLCLFLTAVDMIVRPGGLADRSLPAAEMHPRVDSQNSAVETMEHFRTAQLRPYLELLMANVLTACNATTDDLMSSSSQLKQVLSQRKLQDDLAAERVRGVDHHRADAALNLPWWAKARHVDGLHGDHRTTDFPSMSGAVDSFMSRYLSPERSDGLAENITFATNTADKLVYQLNNFEPMHHKFASPQWNGITLQAQRRLGAKYPRAFLIGISSVNRQTNYLVSTLLSMISALDEEERHMVHIVVFNGNYPPERHEDVAAVRLQFAAEISTGLIEIVELQKPHKELKDPTRLARRWGDSLERVVWRSKQVLDVAALMQYCADKAYAAGGNSAAASYHYFLMMEDDIISSKHFVRRLRAWVDTHVVKKTDWTMLSFYNPWPVQDMEQLPPNKFFGVIGQLFRVHDLPVVVEFLKKNFDQSPLDWLFVDFLKKVSGSIIVHTPSLFQHQGTVSSLDGKRQTGESVDFVAH